MNDIPNLPVYAKNVLEMITVANDYCLTMDKIENHTKSFLYGYLQKVFPLLYLKGTLLQDISRESSEANERFVSEENWESLFNMLRKKIDADDEFWFMDNSDMELDEPVKGSLSECISDIYQDLKDFILLYQKKSLAAKENAVFELKKSFEKHWGFKIVIAQKALHYHLMKGIPQDDPEPGINFL